jgi:hypothetical protein
MTIFEIHYIIAAAIALTVCIPQIRQLLATKRSDEFSLRTWATWTVTQTVTLSYVASIGDVLLVCVSIAWVSFYAIMSLLILRYRRPVTVMVMDDRSQP